METLAVPYLCVIHLCAGLSAGESLRASLQNFLQRRQDGFSQELGKWFLQGASSELLQSLPELRKNPYRVALVNLIASGLKGQSIYNQLLSLKEEIHQASIEELESELRTQPIKLLFPLLLCQLPAFFVLLFGPITSQLLRSLGG